MRWLLKAAAAFFLTRFSLQIASTPLTIELQPKQEECLFLDVLMDDCIVKYHFNVQDWSSDDEFVDYKIYYAPQPVENTEKILFKKQKKPHGNEVLLFTETKQSVGERQFSSEKKGEYQICFESKTQKAVGVDIYYELSEENKNGEDLIVDPLEDNMVSLKQINDLAEDSTLKQLISRLDQKVDRLRSNLDYYKLRNLRNFKTVESTMQRITWFSLGIMMLISLICLLQFLLLKYFFKKEINHINKRH